MSKQKKKKIIFLPGMMSDQRLWEPQIDALRNQYDISVLFSKQHDSMNSVCEEFATKLKKGTAVIGTSMGGYIACALYKRFKDKISHLGLLNTNAVSDNAVRKEQRQFEIKLGEDDFIERIKTKSHFEHFLYKSDRRIISVLQAMNRDFGYDALKNHHKICMSRKDNSLLIARAAIPLLVLGGQHDAVTPPEHQIALARANPNAKLVLLPQCGHIATLEAAAQITYEIKNLIER